MSSNGWPVQTLEEICEFRGGGTPSKAVAGFWTGQIPWVSPKDMKFDVITESVDRITPEAVRESTTNLIPKGAILVVVRSGILAHTIPVAIAGRELAINQDIKALCPSNRIDSRFLFYFLRSRSDEMLKLASRGATVHRIMADRIRRIQIVLPPLPEQQRIVGILDQAFAAIATAEANAEKNLQNARDVFESELSSIFVKRKSWKTNKLQEVCEKITDGTHQTPKYFNEGVVFLSSRNVTSGIIDWDNIKYIDQAQHEQMHKRVAPRRDDILLAKNGTTGVAAIVDRDTVFDIYVSLAMLRALPVVRPRFLLHFINSPPARAQFNKRLKGIGVPNLHLEEIREVVMPFPAELQAQDEVVKAVDRLAAATQRLATLYQLRLAALEALKKSLLHQAFSGQMSNDRANAQFSSLSV